MAVAPPTGRSFLPQPTELEASHWHDQSTTYKTQPSLNRQPNTPLNTVQSGAGGLRKLTTKLKIPHSLSSLPEKGGQNHAHVSKTSTLPDAHLTAESTTSSQTRPRPTAQDLRRAAALRDLGLLPASKRYASVFDDMAAATAATEPKEPGDGSMSAAQLVKQDWEMKANGNMQSSVKRVEASELEKPTEPKKSPQSSPSTSFSLLPSAGNDIPQEKQTLSNWKFPVQPSSSVVDAPTDGSSKEIHGPTTMSLAVAQQSPASLALPVNVDATASTEKLSALQDGHGIMPRVHVSTPSSASPIAESPTTPIPSTLRPSPSISQASVLSASHGRSRSPSPECPPSASSPSASSFNESNDEKTPARYRNSSTSTAPSLSYTVSTETTRSDSLASTYESVDGNKKGKPSRHASRPPAISHCSSDGNQREACLEHPRIKESPIEDEFDLGKPSLKSGIALPAADVVDDNVRIDEEDEFDMKEAEFGLAKDVRGVLALSNGRQERHSLAPEKGKQQSKTSPIRSISLFGRLKHTNSAEVSAKPANTTRSRSSNFLRTKASLPVISPSPTSGSVPLDTTVKARKGTGSNFARNRISSVFGGRRASAQPPAINTSPPPRAFAVTMHSNATIIAQTAGLEDEESRRLAELCFMD